MVEQMTKAQARGWIRRVREDLRDTEAALRGGNNDALYDAMADASAAAAEVQSAAEDGLVRGMRTA